MSAAKMVADSTQGDSTTDSRKRKKKIKKSVAAKNKVVLPEDEDSDLDLKRILHPIGFYLKDRSTMIEEMFHSVRGASLQRALPELLKSMPLEELKDLCLEQLEVMSKKRIQRILAGEESTNISSSGTDDMDDDEEDVDSSDEDLSGGAAGVGGVVTDEVQSRDINVNNAGIQKREAGSDEGGPELAADSTSAVVNSSDQDQSHQSAGQQEGVDSGNVNVNNSDETDKQQEPPPPPIGEVYIKQEPPDSEPEQGRARHYRRRRSRSGSSDRSRSSSRSRSRSRSRSSSGSSYRRRRRRRRRRRSSSSRTSSSSRSSRSGRSSEADKASLIEGGYEDPPEAYTSGSEDGELVRKEVVPKAPVVKQEVMSDVDDGGDGVVQSQDVDDKLTKVSTDGGQVNENIPDPTLATPSVGEIEGDLLALASTADTSGDKGDVEEGDDDDDGDNDEDNDDDDHDGDDDEHKDTDGAVGENDGGSVAGGDESGDGDAGESSATPSVTMDHMELLELEMRARAIKAMLMTSSQAEEGSEKKSEGV